MSSIVGGLGIAHTPSMGVAYDAGMATKFDPAWGEWYEGTRPAAAWAASIEPTLAIIVYNDHMNYFDLSAIPNIALGVAAEYPQADEGFGLRDFPTFPGDTDYSWSLAESLTRSGFDLTYCHELELDHGVYSWAPYIFPSPWPVRVVPLAINTLVHPIPSAQRLWDLGHAIRSAIMQDKREERILIVSTGGLSHQIHGSRFGQTNSRFDKYFLTTLSPDPYSLLHIPTDVLMKLAGTEAGELGMWFAMRAAIGERPHMAYSHYSLPGITGCGVLCLEPGET